MKRIEKLQGSVSSKLQSQLYTVSLTSAVSELIQNSVDAKASKIDVLIDFKEFKILVKDNGTGVSPDDLNRLGQLNFTSKITHLNDLADLNTFGFRGESLHFIANVSNTVVLSKRLDYNSTWVKKISNGEKAVMCSSEISQQYQKDDFFELKPFEMNKSGTIVLVNDLLASIPVRRMILSKVPLFKQIQTVKNNILQILTKDSKIAISVRYISCTSGTNPDISNIINYNPSNINKSNPHFYSHLTRSIFGPIIEANMFKKISINYKDYSLHGIVSKISIRSKELQFIFINDRKYHNNVFMKEINNIFKAASFGKNENLNSSTRSVGKPYNYYPFFLLDIKKPQTVDELIQDPTKNIVRCNPERILHSLIIKVMNSFLSTQGYISKNENSPSPLSPMLIKDQFTEKKFYTAKKIANTIPPIESQIKFAKYNKSDIISKHNIEIPRVYKKAKICKPIHTPQLQLLHINIPSLKSIISKQKISNCWLDIKRIDDNARHDDTELSIVKDQLKFSKVINQVDNKFILLWIPTVSPPSKISQSSLAMLDQHACDERIKLESYLQEFIAKAVDGTLEVQTVVDSHFEISTSETNLFRHFKEEFSKWGIFYESDLRTLRVTRMPNILNDKYKGDNHYLRQILLQHANDLSELRKNRFTTVKNSVFQKDTNSLIWWKFSNCIPNFFIDLFNSKACRSAIMFGDKLTKEECILLLTQLNNCYFPFKCAHGRPSVVPIVALKDIQENDTNESKINPDYII